MHYQFVKFEVLQLYCTIAFEFINKQGIFYMDQTKTAIEHSISTNGVFNFLRRPYNAMPVNIDLIY